jgi:phosphate transport system substrate-binding protein
MCTFYEAVKTKSNQCHPKPLSLNGPCLSSNLLFKTQTSGIRRSSMNRKRVAFSFLLSLTILVLWGSSDARPIDLLGAGATFPYPLYSKMFYVYWQKTGVKINYQAIGSGGGQRQLVNMTVDFGGSDAFMSDEALERASGKILHIPSCLGAVVITYNLPGDPLLKFTPSLISDIFLGKVTKWNDERITRINPGQDLPAMNMVVAHRSDGSGTTFVFTDYLSKVSKNWRERVGRGKAVNWPVGLGSKGNPGVAGLIKYFPGAVGYVELVYALRNQMPAALIENNSGRFIKPSTDSTSMAADVSLPEDTRISITDTVAPEGYPITSFTWILVFKEQAYRGRSMEKTTELSKALWWMIHEGQQYAKPLHYAPLSVEAVSKAERIIKSVTYNGRAVLN